MIEREQSQLTDEQAYIGALATYAEAMLSGTTSIVDMCVRPEPALAAARDIGIRATIVPYVADTKPFAPTLDQNARLLESNDDKDARVRVWVGLHDLESCSDGAVRAGASLRAPTAPGCICIARRRASRSSELGRGSAVPRSLIWLASARSMLTPCWPTAYGHRKRIENCWRQPVHMSHIVSTPISSWAPGLRRSLTCAGEVSMSRLQRRRQSQQSA